ncbi:MAG: choice-of-anchor D domain-containing protein [Candidatus Sulfotelmatobacter sp.]
MTQRPRVSRPIYVSLIYVSMAALAVLLVVSYFPLSAIRAASSGATILPSAAKPLVNLKNPQTLKVTYTGASDAVAALQSGAANPTALASADFDADGAPDVIAGYSTKAGGALVLYRGNPDAYAPADLTLYGKAAKGSVPPTFMPKAQAFSLPQSPDLIVTGDFNLDGHKDVLVGTRGGGLYLLAGDGHGNLLPPQVVPVTGQVTAMDVAGDSHVAVSMDSPSGAQLVILNPGTEGLTAGASYPLSDRGDAVAWGNLGGGADVAVGAGSNVVMIYNALKENAQVETVPVPVQVKGLALGDFIWDQDARQEISVLGDDGSIHILQHGTLITAPLTAAQLPGRRAAMLAKSKLPSNPTALGAWSVARQLPYTGTAPTAAVSHSAFNSPRVASSSTHDLMVLDAGQSQLHILDTSGKTASPSASVSFTNAPVAAMALPQKIDSGRDVVVLAAGQAAPVALTVEPDVTLTVSTTADIDSTGVCTSSSTTVPSPLSLRAAVCIANNSAPATSTVNVPAGTYSLTSLETGELEVGTGNAYSLTINGTGTTANTIIQQTDGKDRIIEQDPNFSGDVNITVENVTVEGGDCTSGQDCPYGGGFMLGGGPSGTPDNVTLTNVVVSNNTASLDEGNGENGGAMDLTSSGTFTFSNCTFSGNTADYGTTNDGGGAGGAIYVEENSGGGNLTITNCAFTNNTAQNGGGGAIYSDIEGSSNTTTITGSTFTGNSALDDAHDGGDLGGAINATGNITMSNSRIVGNTNADGSSNADGLYTAESAGESANAANNWWGCNGGPGSSGCDTVGGSGGSQTTSPVLTLSIGASSTQINPGQTSTLTAKLNDNGTCTGYPSCYVPNGTPVTFSGGSLGSVNPSSTSFTSGIATSIFTAGSNGGTASPSVTVDNQTESVNISIGTPPQITSPDGETFIVGVNSQATVTTTGSPTPTISESGALPNGITFTNLGNGTATLTGTPAVGSYGTYNIIFTASNGVLPNATQNFTLTVNQAPAITSANSTTFMQNVAGSFTITATGYPAATISESGTLPTGVTFTGGTSSATISGTPTQAGTFPITFTASNGVSPNATQNFTLTVNAAQYTLTIGPSPAGSGTTSPTSGGSYNSGTVVPITATANSGYAFVNWTSSPDSVASPTSPSTTITMNNNETVTANFTAVIVASPTTTVVSSNNDPSFTTAPGNSVTFTATVTSNSTVNEGTVTFSDPANDFTCSGGNTVPVSNGQATCTTSFSTEVSENITAFYNGTVNFQTSSGFITQTVNNHTVVTGNQFCNQGPITVPSTAGAATPYPSNIFVTGLSGNVGAVTVNLNNISSSDIQQTDLLLVGPTGAAIIPFAAVGDGSTIGGVNVTLDDSASGLIPGGSPLVSGTYQPTSITGSTSLVFPPPAPVVNASNYAATDGAATLTSTFQNTAPNGTWALYAMDHSGSGAATIGGGWCVNITPPAVQTTITTSPAGLLVSVDGGTATAAPLVENWIPGSSHTIATTSPQAGAAGVQYVWSSWSDSGAISHSITVPSTATTYTASFTTQYQLTTQASPSADGTVTPPSGGYYAGGAIVPVTATANSGFAFSNWTSTGGSFGSTTSASTNFTMPSAPATVTGNFTANAVQITITTTPAGLLVSADGGTPTAAPLVENWTPGSSHTIATTSPQSGSTGVQYVWSNWSDSGAISHSINVPSTATTYTASFTTQYQLTTLASPSADGTVTPPSGGYYAGGAIIPVTATANSGFQFSNWTSTGGSFGSTTSPSTNFTMPSAPATVTGNFTAATQQITITTSPANLLVSADGGPFTAAPLVESWTSGSSHTIATTSPQSGGTGVQYVWSSWSDGGAISHSITVPSTAATYTASFSTQYQLTTAANPSNGGTVSPTSGGFYASGTVVPLTATPNAGYTFSNWTGAVANPNSATTTVTMVAPESVTANFSSAPAITLTPTSINFGTAYLYSLNGREVTVKNTGTSSVTINSVTVTPGAGTNKNDFNDINFCPKTLAAGKSCTVSVVFLAGNIGSLSATLNVNDNASGSPQKVSLSATVINPQASYNPRSLSFGTVKVGHSSTKEVTLTSSGTTALDITSISITGPNESDYTQSNACPSPLSPGADCVISVTFTPSKTGARSADLTVVDNAAISKQNVLLTGKGD